MIHFLAELSSKGHITVYSSLRFSYFLLLSLLSPADEGRLLAVMLLCFHCPWY